MEKNGYARVLVPIVVYLLWVLLWGIGVRLFRHTDFEVSRWDFAVAVYGGLGFLIGYFLFHKDRSEICQRYYPTHPVMDEHGYWRVHLDQDHDICFAREMEKDHVPKSSKPAGIGKAQCLVLDTSAFSMDEEARVWVWLETIVKPSELETYRGDI